MRIMAAAPLLLAPLLARAQCIAEFSCAVNADTARFTNLSNAPGAEFWWDFGDGRGAFAHAPTHVFPETGRYLVTLHALDTLTGCHDAYQQWIDAQRLSDEPCQPGMSLALWNDSGTDRLAVFDASTGCEGTQRLCDGSNFSNWPPGSSFTLATGLEGALCYRIRYHRNDSVRGRRIIRQAFHTLHHQYDPFAAADTCSADFLHWAEVSAEGTTLHFRTLGAPGADTVWISGFGNPIPVIGRESTWFVAHHPLLQWAGHLVGTYRRNRNPAHGCNRMMQRTLNLPNPFWKSPPTCILHGQPADQWAFAGGQARFIAETDSGAVRKWQLNDGTGWTDLADAGSFSGAATDTLTVSNCQEWWSGHRFRCVVTPSSSFQNCHNTSAEAMLTVVAGAEPTGEPVVRFAPNPCGAILHVEHLGGAPIERISILDGAGRACLEAAFSAPRIAVDVSALAGGLYAARLNAGGNSHGFLFMKD